MVDLKQNVGRNKSALRQLGRAFPALSGFDVLETPVLREGANRLIPAYFELHITIVECRGHHD